MTNLLPILRLVLLFLNYSSAANVLMIHPAFSRSHEIVFVTLGEELASRGHNVTLVRFWHPKAMKTEKVKSVMLEIETFGRPRIPYMTDDGSLELPQELFWTIPFDWRSVPRDVLVPARYACEDLLSNKTFNLLFGTGTGYHVAIVDLLFNECALALMHRHGIPSIAYWGTFANGGELFWASTPANPSIVPSLMSFYTDRMTFLQRFVNTVHYLGARIFAQLVMVNSRDDIIADRLPGTPRSAELINNISLVFINSDFSLDYPRPLSPNTINIGCVQCRPARPLPKVIENFMQSSGDNGVIVFSLGATLNSKYLPLHVTRQILDSLGKLKQKVIFKFEGEVDDIPSNVLVLKWVPLQDILGHNKTKLFISHCGMHSVMESIYHSVPIIAIPLVIDQRDIAIRLVQKQVAVEIDKFQMSSELLYSSIRTVLSNKSYYKNVKKLSAILKDNWQSPMERAVFWVEYVVRYSGAEHLKSSDRFLNIFQYLLLDVLSVFVLCVFIVSHLTKRLWKVLACNEAVLFEKPKKA